ncbi:hypothetical protein JTB14_029451 [Gonioctena quinquepunctata]|nr:hypothetical protein JTB14_029451 [Gonioctena quinquepunctata]
MRGKSLPRSLAEVLAQNYGDPNTGYDAEDLIPLNQLRRNMLFLAEEITDISDMLNVLTEQNLMNVEIGNWLENMENYYHWKT